MTYAQDREDLIVLDYFRWIGIERGRFLDIGAGDFKLISNTRLLAEKGWTGLLVEPSYRNMPALLKELSDFPGVEVLNAAVSVRSGISRFYDPPTEPFISTLSEDLLARGHERTGSIAFSVATVTPLDIYQRYGPFDFISIDAEGLSVEILAACSFDIMTARAVCVEFFPEDVLGKEHTEAGVLAVLKREGFRHLATTKENVIGVR